MMSKQRKDPTKKSQEKNLSQPVGEIVQQVVAQFRAKTTVSWTVLNNLVGTNRKVIAYEL